MAVNITAENLVVNLSLDHLTARELLYFVQSEEHQSFIVTLVVDLINVNLHLSVIVPFLVFMFLDIQL